MGEQMVETNNKHEVKYGIGNFIVCAKVTIKAHKVIVTNVVINKISTAHGSNNFKDVFNLEVMKDIIKDSLKNKNIECNKVVLSKLANASISKQINS